MPESLFQSGSSARVMVCMELDTEGRVQNHFVTRGSGLPEADRAALLVAGVVRFDPGQRAGEAIPWTLVFPVTFTRL